MNEALGKLLDQINELPAGRMRGHVYAIWKEAMDCGIRIEKILNDHGLRDESEPSCRSRR